MSGIVPITIQHRSKQLLVANIRDVKSTLDFLIRRRPRDKAELERLAVLTVQAIGGYVSPRSAFNAFASYAHREGLVVKNKSAAWSEFEQTIRSAKTRDDIKAVSPTAEFRHRAEETSSAGR